MNIYSFYFLICLSCRSSNIRFFSLYSRSSSRQVPKGASTQQRDRPPPGVRRTRLEYVKVGITLQSNPFQQAQTPRHERKKGRHRKGISEKDLIEFIGDFHQLALSLSKIGARLDQTNSENFGQYGLEFRRVEIGRQESEFFRVARDESVEIARQQVHDRRRHGMSILFVHDGAQTKVQQAQFTGSLLYEQISSVRVAASLFGMTHTIMIVSGCQRKSRDK